MKFGTGRPPSKHKGVRVKVQNDICMSKHICDRFWGNRPKRGKQFFSVSPGKALWADFFQKKFYGRNG